MPDKPRVLVDTDILVDHLICDKDSESLLEKLMMTYICFTTVINASELYFAVRNEKEKTAVDKLLRSLKVLGMNARYSMLIPDFKETTESLRDALICALSKNNKLALVTNKKEKYKFADIKLIDPNSLRG
jgi:predicted nucleic acid-binding protein